MEEIMISLTETDRALLKDALRTCSHKRIIDGMCDEQNPDMDLAELGRKRRINRKIKEKRIREKNKTKPDPEK